MWEFEEVNAQICEMKCEKEVMIFGFGYVRVDVLEKFMGVCESSNDCKEILNFFKV